MESEHPVQKDQVMKSQSTLSLTIPSPIVSNA
jgi:hypothetical protein